MQPGLANTQPYSMRNLLQRSYVWNIYVQSGPKNAQTRKERIILMSPHLVWSEDQKIWHFRCVTPSYLVLTSPVSVTRLLSAVISSLFPVIAGFPL